MSTNSPRSEPGDTEELGNDDTPDLYGARRVGENVFCNENITTILGYDC